jgi:hypothetical protein
MAFDHTYSNHDKFGIHAEILMNKRRNRKWPKSERNENIEFRIFDIDPLVDSLHINSAYSTVETI